MAPSWIWFAYLAVLGLLGIYAAHRLYLIGAYLRRPKEQTDPPPSPLPRVLPTVTVQLPLFNERFVAERLIDAVAALDWPIDKLEIQVLDDSTDDTAQICRARCEHWRARGHRIEHLHRTDRSGFKAGALQAGLERARGELVLVLDADFLPPPQLLKQTVGHFSDPEVGMVQARWEHLNRDHSTLTRVQALLLDGHFVVEQSVRARTGKFFNFNGTAGVWRREAVESAGGWHCDTLTEDLDLSYRALLEGWRFVYLLGQAAPAELPVDMNSFKSQQYRWAKGSVQVARKLLPKVMRAPLPRSVKIEAFFHLTQNVPYAITLLLVLLCAPALLLVAERPGDSWLLALPLLVGSVGTLAAYCATSQRALPSRDSLARTLARLPALIAITAGISVSQTRAVIEGAFGHESEFVRTPKHGVIGGAAGKKARRRYRGLRSLTPIAEIALAIYFAFSVWYAVVLERVIAIPILAVFAIGFAYVGMRSIART